MEKKFLFKNTLQDRILITKKVNTSYSWQLIYFQLEYLLLDIYQTTYNFAIPLVLVLTKK